MWMKTIPRRLDSCPKYTMEDKKNKIIKIVWVVFRLSELASFSPEGGGFLSAE
jgi:hypothetical protein